MTSSPLDGKFESKIRNLPWFPSGTATKSLVALGRCGGCGVSKRACGCKKLECPQPQNCLRVSSWRYLGYLEATKGKVGGEWLEKSDYAENVSISSNDDLSYDSDDEAIIEWAVKEQYQEHPKVSMYVFLFGESEVPFTY